MAVCHAVYISCGPMSVWPIVRIMLWSDVQMAPCPISLWPDFIIILKSKLWPNARLRFLVFGITQLLVLQSPIHTNPQHKQHSQCDWSTARYFNRLSIWFARHSV